MSDMQPQSSSSLSFPDSLDPIQRRNHEESKRLAIAASDAAKRAERELAEAKSAVVAEFGLPQIDLSTISNPRLAHSILSEAAELILSKKVDYICYALDDVCIGNSDPDPEIRSVGIYLCEAIGHSLYAEQATVYLNSWAKKKNGGWALSEWQLYHLRLAWIDAMQFQLEQMI